MFSRTAIVLLLGLSTASAEISFNNDIRPLLSNTCYRCHGPDSEDRQADLRLDTAEGSRADRDGTRAVVPGNLDASELIHRITTTDPDDLMPPPNKGDKFTPEQVELLKQWIAEGAEYETHWSYVKPVRPAIPVTDTQKPTLSNEIDAFVLRRLEKEGLTYSPAADRQTLARRLSLDLTGLPPTPAEVDAFLADETPDAYEKLVDRLLAKPAFGEHWVRMWLDLARYADSAGYADDPPRTIWAYRDWVIRALNDNMPFDQFTIEQLAGDLLENPTQQQLVATAFHRNTQTNNEGGTNDEEFRNVAVVDRVNTTMATWMGTTMACAQCHTHKYDPITHEEYFQMFAIFNQSQDADRKNESPLISVNIRTESEHRSTLEAKIAALKKAARQPDEADLAELAKWEANLETEPIRWRALSPIETVATSGATFTQGNDQSVVVSGKSAPTDRYTISAQTDLEQVTAIKIEALAYPKLGDGGPGRNGNFVLNEIRLTGGDLTQTKRGRFVRIDLPGENKYLHLAEVQVFDTKEKNVALKGVARQSSTADNGDAHLAIDDNTDGNLDSNSTTHTAGGDTAAFWEVDLGTEHELASIVVWNRTDSEAENRLDGYKLSVLDAQRTPVWQQTFATAPKREQTVALDGATLAQFASASASYEQKKFGAAAAIDGSLNSKSGWSVAGATGKDNHAIFEFAARRDVERHS